MLLTDLNELKSMLDIPMGDTSEDKKLLILVDHATNIIEEIVDRPDMSYRQRTEYLSGTGTLQLCLRGRPAHVSPAPRVWIDGNGFFGQASGAFASTTEKTFGVDFFLKVSDGSGISRSGILVAKGGWPKPSYRQGGWLSPFIGPAFGNIKAVFYGGWTLDTLPSSFRTACNLLVARMAYLFPLGIELSSESFQERSISVVNSDKAGLLALARPLILQHKNWSF